MTIPTRFRVTLHVCHPALSAEEIIGRIGLPPVLSQTVGANRKTRQGKPLSGRYKATNVSFALHDALLSIDDVSLPQFIEDQLNHFNKGAFFQLSESGGASTFVVGIYCEEFVGVQFCPRLMQLLVELKIGINLSIYGGPDDDGELNGSQSK